MRPARDLLEEASGRAWNASLERSHWQISFGEGQAPVRCQEGLWDPDADAGAGGAPVALALELGGKAPVLEQVSKAPTCHTSRFDGCLWQCNRASYLVNAFDVAIGRAVEYTLSC